MPSLTPSLPHTGQSDFFFCRNSNKINILLCVEQSQWRDVNLQQVTCFCVRFKFEQVVAFSGEFGAALHEAELLALGDERLARNFSANAGPAALFVKIDNRLRA
jgi:hypothetical protein